MYPTLEYSKKVVVISASWRHRIHPELLLPLYRPNSSSSSSSSTSVGSTGCANVRPARRRHRARTGRAFACPPIPATRPWRPPIDPAPGVGIFQKVVLISASWRHRIHPELLLPLYRPNSSSSSSSSTSAGATGCAKVSAMASPSSGEACPRSACPPWIRAPEGCSG
jgi:hypothetical protein